VKSDDTYEEDKAKKNTTKENIKEKAKVEEKLPKVVK
jgi:hypothetical protein